MKKANRQHTETFARIVGGVSETVSKTQWWPSPISDGEWIDPAGVRWSIGRRHLDPNKARDLYGRPNVRVVLFYGMHPQEMSGASRDELWARIDAFFNGNAPDHSGFQLAQFRDGWDNTMVIQEHC